MFLLYQVLKRITCSAAIFVHFFPLFVNLENKSGMNDNRAAFTNTDLECTELPSVQQSPFYPRVKLHGTGRGGNPVMPTLTFLIGELANAILFYISFYGKAKEDFGEDVGERRDFPHGDAMRPAERAPCLPERTVYWP